MANVAFNGVAEVTESGLQLPVYDFISNAPTSTTDVFSFYQGGSGGLLVATVAIVYTDATKGTIDTVTKTVP